MTAFQTCISANKQTLQNAQNCVDEKIHCFIQKLKKDDENMFVMMIDVFVLETQFFEQSLSFSFFESFAETFDSSLNS